jgi:gas vesicle protein
VIKMSWKDILKLDREERIRGILSNWLDSVLDWAEDLKIEINDDKVLIQNELKNLEDMISEQAEYLQDVMRSLLPDNVKQLAEIIDQTTEKIEEMITEISSVQSRINDEELSVNLILRTIQEAGLIESIAVMDNISKNKSPTAPNIDRLRGQLELGEGYEE